MVGGLSTLSLSIVALLSTVIHINILLCTLSFCILQMCITQEAQLIEDWEVSNFYYWVKAHSDEDVAEWMRAQRGLLSLCEVITLSCGTHPFLYTLNMFYNLVLLTGGHGRAARGAGTGTPSCT